MNNDESACRSYVSYDGQFLNEDLFMEFKYFIDDNTYKITFYSYKDNEQIDLTEQYIHTERIQPIITTLIEFAQKCFT